MLLLCGDHVVAPFRTQCGRSRADVKRLAVLAACRLAIKPQLPQFCACSYAKALLIAPPLRQIPRMFRFLPAPVSGRSSGVEHNLAKVGVEGSNPFARSSFPRKTRVLWKALAARDRSVGLRACLCKRFASGIGPVRSGRIMIELLPPAKLLPVIEHHSRRAVITPSRRWAWLACLRCPSCATAARWPPSAAPARRGRAHRGRTGPCRRRSGRRSESSSPGR